MGAVYKPLVETVPPVADQVTEVFVDPATVAVNCCVLPVATDAVVGVRLTDTPCAVVNVASPLVVLCPSEPAD